VEDQEQDADEVEEATTPVVSPAVEPWSAAARWKRRSWKDHSVPPGHEEGPAPAEGGDVIEDEEEAEVAAEPLQAVAPVGLVLVAPVLALAGHGVVDAEDGVEGD
jgi:hypothetical protein